MSGRPLLIKLLLAGAAFVAFLHMAVASFPQGPTFEGIEAGLYETR